MASRPRLPLRPIAVNAPAAAGVESEKKKSPLPQGEAAIRSSSLRLQMRIDAAAEESCLPIPSSCEVWAFSDSEAPAPASSWATLPNRALLCRPLPLDVGRCTCVIAKEGGAAGAPSLYALYTNEGHGRQDRKLAVARHRRRRGRSEFLLAQNPQELLAASGDGMLGTVSANLVGSKYQIWGQESCAGAAGNEPRRSKRSLLGVVMFAPTVTTLTGSYRSIRAWVPKNTPAQSKNPNPSSSQIRHVKGLPKDWEESNANSNSNSAVALCSRTPLYNTIARRYELDFRERAAMAGHQVQPSVKNFQMAAEGNAKRTVLQLGRVGKSKYIMDFRHPLTGYQAFCICLASMDAKLCCAL